MAIDKAVDSAKLDAALVATADAIRAKGGGTAKLAWKETNGFADEIDTLPDAVPEVTQATPSITVSSGGLITASATQSAGKVAAGTKSATKQLTTQGAKTVTPTASEQVAVPAGVFTTGAVKVAGVTAASQKVVQGTVYLRDAENTMTISGLTLSKIKSVFVSKNFSVSSIGSLSRVVNILLVDGSCKAYTYASGNYLYYYTNDYASYSYSAGVLTITTRSGYYLAEDTTWAYTIVGE